MTRWLSSLDSRNVRHSQLRTSYQGQGATDPIIKSLITRPVARHSCFRRTGKQMTLNEQGPQKIERQNSRQQVKHAKLYSDLLLGLKGILNSSGFPAVGSLINASLILHLGLLPNVSSQSPPVRFHRSIQNVHNKVLEEKKHWNSQQKDTSSTVQILSKL